MQTRILPFILALMLSHCVRGASSSPVPVEDDKSIVFPPFFEQDAVGVEGVRGKPYELDGETLRALSIAANDFLPSHIQDPACWNKQEAQFYRVIRQGDIFFVSIRENPAHCGLSSPALDSGAKYAISADGRILRRVLDGQPEEPGLSVNFDGGPRGVPARPGVPPGYDAIWDTKPDASTPADKRFQEPGLTTVPAPPGHDPTRLPPRRDGGSGADGGAPSSGDAGVKP
jgi:hypothetical protein